MAYEKECDMILRQIVSDADNFPNKVFDSFRVYFSVNGKIEEEALHKSIAILIAEDMLIATGDIHAPIKEWSKYKFRITPKGRAFAYTDSFESRAEKWEFQKEMKDKELIKLRWDVSKMKITYYMALSGFILSIIALIPNSAWHQLCAILRYIFQRQ